MTLGQRIQQIRIEHGLSQEQFGEKLGTTRQTVSRWELDQACPEISKIVLISRLFSVTTDSLLKDGVSTFDTELNCFSCGVYRGSSAEIVETEKFALVFYCKPDKQLFGTRLYKGYENKKKLVAICERNNPENKTEYAYVFEENNLGVTVANSEKLALLLGEAYDKEQKEAMRRTEVFAVDHSGSPLPTVKEAGIPRCLTLWRTSDSYRAARDRFNFYLCTGKTEYIFSIRPTDTDIYCGASYNTVFDLGVFGSGQFFRIRNYKDNSADWCGFYYDFSYEPSDAPIPIERCELGKCIDTDRGFLWCVKRYTDGEIVLQGCGDDEYIYRRNEKRTERFKPIEK